MMAEVHLTRALPVTIAVWLVCVGVAAFLSLVWMRECSTRAIVIAVSGIAITALVVFVLLALTGRATPGRIAAVVVGSWIGLIVAYRVCNLPNPETREYLRQLGDPSGQGNAPTERDPGPDHDRE